MAFMDSNDEVSVSTAALVDEEGQPVAGATITGWEAQYPDGSDATVPDGDGNPALVSLVVSDDGQSCVVKSNDRVGTCMIIAHTANGSGQAGGDQTGQLDIGEPNVVTGSVAFGVPTART